MRSLVGSLLNKAPVSYVPKTGLNLFGQSFGTSKEKELGTMEGVGTLFAIVDRLATSTASIDWHLYRKAASGKKEDREEVLVHPALSVWSKPNPHYSQSEFVEAIEQHYDLTGEYWWLISRSSLLGGNGPPIELWPVRPDKMAPVPHPTEFISGYIYTNGKEEVALKTTDVLRAKRQNPLDPYRGMSPVGSLILDIEGERAAAAYNRNFFTNGAEPGGIIEVDKHLSDPEFEEMTQRWRAQHQGVSNAHRVAVLEQGKWVPRLYSRRDMEFVELRKFSKDSIRQAYAFPKPLLGDTEDINKANALAAADTFARYLVVPRLDRIRDTLNFGFLPLFGSMGKGYEFDYANAIPEDAEQVRADRTAAVESAIKLIQEGFDPTEVLDKFGLPELTHTTKAVAVDTPRALAEMVQKIYLGIGKVITADEARDMLNQAGASLGAGFAPTPTTAEESETE